MSSLRPLAPAPIEALLRFTQEQLRAASIGAGRGDEARAGDKRQPPELDGSETDDSEDGGDEDGGETVVSLTIEELVERALLEAASLVEGADLQDVRRAIARLFDLSTRTDPQAKRRLLAEAKRLQALEQRMDPDATQAPESMFEGEESDAQEDGGAGDAGGDADASGGDDLSDAELVEEGQRILAEGETQNPTAPGRSRASRADTKEQTLASVLRDAYELLLADSATGGERLRAAIRKMITTVKAWARTYERAARMLRALEAKLKRVGDGVSDEPRASLRDSQMADGQWLVERILRREPQPDARGRTVWLVQFIDPDPGVTWPPERTTEVSKDLIDEFKSDRKRRGVPETVLEGGDGGGGGGGGGGLGRDADFRRRALAAARDLVAKTEDLLALDLASAPKADARAAYIAAEAAADAAAAALGAALGVLNADERRFLAARVQLAQFALEAKEAAFELGRQQAGADARLEARKLQKAISELVATLAGDLVEEEEESGGRILVHDHNTASIRFSLVKLLKSAEVLPAPPDFFLPCVEELLLTSLFRLRCTHWPAGLGGDAVRRAVGAVFEMKQESLARAYYGKLLDADDATLADNNLLPATLFRDRELRRIERELRSQQQASAAAAAIERRRLESLLGALPLVRQLLDAVAAGVEDRSAIVASASDALAASVLESADRQEGSWHHAFVRPPRIHQQNDLVRSRGVRTTEYLDWLRKRQFERADESERISDTQGSAYSGEVPASVSVDHVVPQTWFVRSSQLYLNGTPVEDLCQCVLSTRSENSSKSNKPVFFGGADDDLVDSADRSVFRLPPKDRQFFTPARQAVVCRAIAYSFCCYMLVGEGGNDGWRAFDAASGSRYYASLAGEHDSALLRLVAEPVRELEQTAALVLFYVTGWVNPFVTSADLIREPRVRDLFKRRLRGETRVPGALAGALSGVISGFQ
jgi:hypothetical protein